MALLTSNTVAVRHQQTTQKNYIIKNLLTVLKGLCNVEFLKWGSFGLSFFDGGGAGVTVDYERYV